MEKAHPDRSTHLTLRSHLLDELIPAVLDNRPPIARPQSADTDSPLRPRRRYDPDNVRRWLTTLASELQTAGTRDWLWWHLTRHHFPTVRTALTAKLALGLALGVAFGLTSRRAMRLDTGANVLGRYGPVSELVVGLIFGLLAGLMVGLVVGLAFRLTAEPGRTDLQLRGRVPELLRGLTFTLAGGLVLELAFALLGRSGRLTGGLVVGLAGLAVGLAFRLTAEPAHPTCSCGDESRTTAEPKIRAGVRAGAWTGVRASVRSGGRVERWTGGRTGDWASERVGVRAGGWAGVRTDRLWSQPEHRTASKFPRRESTRRQTAHSPHHRHGRTGLHINVRASNLAGGDSRRVGAVDGVRVGVRASGWAHVRVGIRASEPGMARFLRQFRVAGSTPPSPMAVNGLPRRRPSTRVTASGRICLPIPPRRTARPFGALTSGALPPARARGVKSPIFTRLRF